MLAASAAGDEAHQEAAAVLVVDEVLLVAGVGSAAGGAVDAGVDSVVDVVGVEEDSVQGAALAVVAVDLVVGVEAEVDTKLPASDTATRSCCVTSSSVPASSLFIFVYLC